MRSWIHSVKPLGNFSAPNPSGADGAALPPLAEAITDTSADKDGPLARALALLFEASPVLHSDLVPGVASHIQNAHPILSYFALISTSLSVISVWSDDLKAQFIAGHPRIGEVKGLSKLSEQEQATKATPPEVLARLAHLNALYERKYPGLVHITFVNGRSRAEIKDEMEDKLGLEHSVSADEPSAVSIVSVEKGSEEWKGELERAVSDVGKIARSRLRSLGVEDSKA
ncbi:OHCU decarboxylase-domain-containing protein [Ganoderma leucocontextum]|nr:OHCU decarboxylase-domain-containing protein [Ganoderma leucocontextum]